MDASVFTVAGLPTASAVASQGSINFFLGESVRPTQKGFILVWGNLDSSLCPRQHKGAGKGPSRSSESLQSAWRGNTRTKESTKLEGEREPQKDRLGIKRHVSEWEGQECVGRFPGADRPH